MTTLGRFGLHERADECMLHQRGAQEGRAHAAAVAAMHVSTSGVLAANSVTQRESERTCPPLNALHDVRPCLAMWPHRSTSSLRASGRQRSRRYVPNTANRWCWLHVRRRCEAERPALALGAKGPPSPLTSATISLPTAPRCRTRTSESESSTSAYTAGAAAPSQ